MNTIPVSSFLLLVLSVPVAASAQTSGRVIDPSGMPVPGARVMSLPWEDTRTDADGRFSLARPADVVRFSRDGYQPRTKLTADANGTITLSPTRERGWSPSVCSGSQAHRFGNVMQFTAPARTTLDQVVDDDYRLTQVRYRGTALT
jgi:protocatechuate 3,4-dioxygenase beta subunit